MPAANFNPSKATYDALHAAFDFFNAELFEGRLPPAMLTIHRKRGARGYFWAEQFRERDDDNLKLDEIALNPEHMGRTPTEVLSTLVHEMTHLEQQHFGEPGKNGHHNKEWGEMMDRVGLEPTSTGEPGGKRTGRKVTHMIVPNGPYDVACKAFLAQGHDLSWFALAPVAAEKEPDTSKVPHICEECEMKVWGKLGIRVYCVDCDERMVPDPAWLEKHGLEV
jgi:predicted SprT family Zn-dependent metalloprotease